MLEEARLIELVKQHLGLSISTDLSDWSNVDCKVYNEQTTSDRDWETYYWFNWFT